VAQVILFGGGDAGGYIITPSGIKPIPPFTPKVLRQLRAVSAMANASKDLSAGQAREFADVLGKLTDTAIGQVASKAGRGEHSFLYMDDDGGGFYCGSTGKPPIPLPGPVTKRAAG